MQHTFIPHISGSRSPNISFSNMYELLSHPIVAEFIRIRSEKFSGWSVGDKHSLMATFNDGTLWICVGYAKTGLVGLPEWKPNKPGIIVSI